MEITKSKIKYVYICFDIKQNPKFVFFTKLQASVYAKTELKLNNIRKVKILLNE